MHEWALAEAVISSATEIAENEGLREVTEVKITVGELQQIELDIRIRSVAAENCQTRKNKV